MLLNAYMPDTYEKKPAVIQNNALNQDISFDELLVKVGQDKDRDSFITLFNHFAPRIKSFLIKAGLQIDTADELAQETMLTIWNKAQSYDPKMAAASTWIFTIARNKRIDTFRKLGRAQFTNIDDTPIIDDSETPLDIANNAQEAQKISKAIKKLPEDQLNLIKKSFFEDKSHAVIAQETGIPLGTVKSRIRLALERLRNESGVKELWN